MTRRKQRNGERARCAYQVEVRGELPSDLRQRISELHALAILHRAIQGDAAQGREGHPPGGSVPDDVIDGEGKNAGLDVLP